jgi:predicted nucleic acid-binding protein
MGKIESPVDVVCDAGPLIHLDELNCLDLLSDFSLILIPEVVWQEVFRHRPAISLPTALQCEQSRSAENLSDQLAALSQLLMLHRGEMEALRLCLLSKKRLLLTDDTAARLAANQLGLSVHGTIGLLLRAIRRSQRSREQVLALLRILPTHSSLHIKRDLLEEVITAVQSCAVIIK